MFAEIYRWFIEILSAILKSTRYGGESIERLYLFGNNTFPNRYDVLVYERKLESEYLERQIYEQLLKTEPSIVKLSDTSKLSTLSQPSIMNVKAKLLELRVFFVFFVRVYLQLVVIVYSFLLLYCLLSFWCHHRCLMLRNLSSFLV